MKGQQGKILPFKPLKEYLNYYLIIIKNYQMDKM